MTGPTLQQCCNVVRKHLDHIPIASSSAMVSQVWLVPHRGVRSPLLVPPNGVMFSPSLPLLNTGMLGSKGLQRRNCGHTIQCQAPRSLLQ